MDPSTFYRILFTLSICINLTLLVLYLNRTNQQVNIVDDINKVTVAQRKKSESFLDISDNKISHLSCSDPTWCTIPMPSSSFFNFDPPTNLQKWKQAQVQAAEGKQVNIIIIIIA